MAQASVRVTALDSTGEIASSKSGVFLVELRASALRAIAVSLSEGNLRVRIGT